MTTTHAPAQGEYEQDPAKPTRHLQRVPNAHRPTNRGAHPTTGGTWRARRVLHPNALPSLASYRPSAVCAD
jgi:hypothetical protein